MNSLVALQNYSFLKDSDLVMTWQAPDSSISWDNEIIFAKCEEMLYFEDVFWSAGISKQKEKKALEEKHSEEN